MAKGLEGCALKMVSGLQDMQGEKEQVTYHVAKLLVESVASPTTYLLVRNLGSNPIAEVLLVFFHKLCPSENDVNIHLRTRETRYLAHSSPGQVVQGKVGVSPGWDIDAMLRSKTLRVRLAQIDWGE